MLTAEQLDQFKEKGYLKLPDMIPAALLEKLHALFDQLMSETNDPADKVIHQNKGKVYVTNLENICNKGNRSCLELLGTPFILSIAEKICGPDFFLIQEFAVNKIKGDELPVLWHQDMFNEQKGLCFTMGIYLDDADEGDGALKVIPGSHLMGKNICELSKLPYIEVPMKRGDILIHDMMVAHSSEPLRKKELRRVIYFEFLSAAHVAAENIYQPSLVERRSRLHHAAIRYYKELHPENISFEAPVKSRSEDESLSIEEILKDIYSAPINARPSAYCFESFLPSTNK